MATRVRSYSKINVGLAIGPVRADGFHGLVTLYQTLALHDVVTVEARRVGWGPASPSQPTTISLTTNHSQVPTDARNTVWKMVELALARMGIAARVAIHIEKELPVQGGLGAGSANAAAALIGLERELGVALPETERMEIAAEVGSDVPLFLIGGAVLGMGRGEVVSAMPDLPATWCVVAVPEVGVSTPGAFRDWDERQAIGSGFEVRGGSMAIASEGKEDRFSSYEHASSKLPAQRNCLPGNEGEPAPALAENSAHESRRAETFGGDCPGAGAQLTSPGKPDTLNKLSHAYASVFGVDSYSGVELQTKQASGTSGIVRGPSLKQQTEGSTLNGLAGNTLLALVRTGIENDFETVVFPQYPLLREIKRLLMGTPADGFFDAHPADSSSNAVYAALSGSGSALFGLYWSEADAREAQRRVQASGCKAILTETLPRQEYWRTMFAE